MKPMYRSLTRCLLPVFAVVFLFTPMLVAADEASHHQQVETLFRLTQMEKKLQESVNTVLQLQLRQYPQLQKDSKKLEAFLQKYIGWEALKADITDMYMKTFSEAELEQINAFYITPAGQKVINVVPQLVQQRNQIAMTRLQNNIGELQQMMKTTPEQ
jgi:uncharacterized protein